MDGKDVLNHTDPPNELVSQCVNALIVAGQTFFAALIATQNVVAAAEAGALTFFTSLAIQRGLQKQQQKG